MGKDKINLSNKQTVINMAANIVSYGSNLVISFVITPFLINTLGKETYSFYPISNTIVSYISVLANSVNAMGSRFVTVSLAKGRDDEANEYFSSVWLSNLLIGFFMMLPMVAAVLLLEHLLDVPINSVAAVKSMFALVFAAALTRVFTANFGIATFAKNRIDLRSLRELVTSGLRLLLYVVLYGLFTPNLLYIGIVALAVELTNLCFQIFYTKKLLPDIKISIKLFTWNKTKELVGSGVWNMINSIGAITLTAMITVLANVLYGATASGLYAIVNIIPSFISGLIPVLAGVFYPAITYRYAQGNINALSAELDKSQRLVSFFCCAAIVTFSAMSRYFFELWAPNEDAVYLSGLLIFAIIPQFFSAVSSPFANLNIATNKVKKPALVILCLGICMVICSYIVRELFSSGLYSLPIISGVFQFVWFILFLPNYAAKNISVKAIRFYIPMLRSVLAVIPSYMFTSWVCSMTAIDSWLKFFTFAVICGVSSLLIFCFAIYGSGAVKMFKLLLRKFQ